MQMAADLSKLPSSTSCLCSFQDGPGCGASRFRESGSVPILQTASFAMYSANASSGCGSRVLHESPATSPKDGRLSHKLCVLPSDQMAWPLHAGGGASWAHDSSWWDGRGQDVLAGVQTRMEVTSHDLSVGVRAIGVAKAHCS